MSLQRRQLADSKRSEAFKHLDAALNEYNNCAPGRVWNPDLASSSAERAIQLFEEAIKIYMELGDSATATSLQKPLSLARLIYRNARRGVCN